MIVLVAAALAGEVGFGVGVDARLGKGAVFVGAGAGPTVRLDLGPVVELHGEARLLVLAGTNGLVRGGVGVHHAWGAWDPGVGVDVGGWFGASLRAVTEENPELEAGRALTLQGRLDPLRFRSEHATVEVLRVELGSGWDRGRPALAVGVTLTEVALRW